MAGPYPSSKDEAQAREILGELMGEGVTCFVALTKPGDGLPGSPLDPYDDLMAEVSSSRGTDARRISGPITDVSIPTVEHMEWILEEMEAAIAAGQVVYVHCWGGVARTGTVIGCHLVDQGRSAEQAIDRIAELRSDTRRSREGRISPETDDQMEFIQRWDQRRSS